MHVKSGKSVFYAVQRMLITLSQNQGEGLSLLFSFIYFSYIAVSFKK